LPRGDLRLDAGLVERPRLRTAQHQGLPVDFARDNEAGVDMASAWKMSEACHRASHRRYFALEPRHG
jgi:hypothetical protein